MWQKLGNVFNDHHSQVPVVDTVNDGYWRVYYSTRNINGKSVPFYFDVDSTNPTKVISKSNKAILQLGEPGYFDWAGVMPTNIISLNDKKYLYYIGWSNRIDVPYHNNLGLALSDDNGATFKKISKGPVFSTSRLEPGYVGTISILIENGIWRAWYLSCQKWEMIAGKMEPFYDIKYAESKNGIDWIPSGITCIRLNEDEGGISQASVVKLNDKYLMWYSYRGKEDYRLNKKNSYRIGFADSIDGITWERKDELAGIDVSPEGWDSQMIEYPYIIKSGENLFMFYNGNGFGQTGIGIATMQIEGYGKNL